MPQNGLVPGETLGPYSYNGEALGEGAAVWAKAADPHDKAAANARDAFQRMFSTFLFSLFALSRFVWVIEVG